MNQKPHLMIATPCYGGQMAVAYVSSLLALQQACFAQNIKVQFNLRSGDALITRVRSELAAEFIASDATHLLFIDADIGFQPEQVFRLLAFDADVTAAAYPLKRIDWEKVRRIARSDQPDLEASCLDYVVYLEGKGPIKAHKGFVRVVYTGAGFLMIRREAWLRMCDAYPNLRYKSVQNESDLTKEPPYRHALFECAIDPETGLYLSEDYAFCRRWRDVGGTIWLDLKSELTHYGPNAFHGKLEKQYTTLAPATHGNHAV